MTMPDERTRALRWAGEFLLKVQFGEEFSAEIKREVKFILRHYPRDFEIKDQARFDASRSTSVWEQWLGPEDSDLR
ncbi:MAG: BPSL0761 family protein [Undibacterium sp.]|uniref:BPSL0761 family protein n=1 Tax=Undibacterium sp. TaxID=1914977 RepID=UPI0027215E86|nr:BPSL0761 family protein [Undibacterium sp.]MDO8651660.1 BPSL0761 family protein [Undibacterium sp.]